jgi:hypothetical protein
MTATMIDVRANGVRMLAVCSQSNALGQNERKRKR